jgi:hypothetical protein
VEGQDGQFTVVTYKIMAHNESVQVEQQYLEERWANKLDDVDASGAGVQPPLPPQQQLPPPPQPQQQQPQQQQNPIAPDGGAGGGHDWNGGTIGGR